MPAAEPQTISREAVKTLAIAVGVREAARQLGLNEDRVLQWSKRQQWFKPTPQPPQQSVITVSKTPSEALAETLTEQGKETRLSLSKGLLSAAKHIEKQPGEKILKAGQNVKAIVGAASQVHGWEERKKDTEGLVSVTLVRLELPQQSEKQVTGPIIDAE